MQSLLLELGFDDVDIAVFNDEHGESTGGFDMRLSIDPFWVDGVKLVDGFLERMTMTRLPNWSAEQPMHQFHWVLQNKTYTTMGLGFEKLVGHDAFDDARRIVRKRENARMAAKLRANVSLTSTLDLPQARKA